MPRLRNGDQRRMDLNRRIFIKTIIAAALAPIAFARRTTSKCTQAVRARIYPGPVKPIDHKKISRPAKWAG